MQKGFTLIELLIIVSVITVAGSIIYLVCDPITRYKHVRNEGRRQHVLNIMAAIKASTATNSGQLPDNILPVGSEAMLGTGSACAVKTQKCNTGAKCIDLMTGEHNLGKYLNVMPIDPAGDPVYSAEMTGYAISRNLDGDIVVKACGAEGKAGIYATK